MNEDEETKDDETDEQEGDDQRERGAGDGETAEPRARPGVTAPLTDLTPEEERMESAVPMAGAGPDAADEVAEERPDEAGRSDEEDLSDEDVEQG